MPGHHIQTTPKEHGMKLRRLGKADRFGDERLQRLLSRATEQKRTWAPTEHGLPMKRMRRALKKGRFMYIGDAPLGPDGTLQYSAGETADMVQVLLLRCMWFDLSELPDAMRDSGLDTGWSDKDTLDADINEFLAHPPAPLTMFLGRVKAEDGSYIVAGNLVLVEGEQFAGRGMVAYYDRTENYWLVLDTDAVEEYAPHMRLLPLVLLYMTALKMQGFATEARSTGTGKLMNLSANPPEGISYRTVRLTAEARERIEHQGGTHASPRKHWRRGHWRHLRNGDRVWIDGMSIGSDERGEVRHDYLIMPEIPQKDGFRT